MFVSISYIFNHLDFRFLDTMASRKIISYTENLNTHNFINITTDPLTEYDGLLYKYYICENCNMLARHKKEQTTNLEWQIPPETCNERIMNQILK